MDVRENVKVWSLCAKFIGHVVLVGVQRVSGLLLTDLVNTITCIQRDSESLTIAVSYGSRQSYAFLALPRILVAFTSKVS